MSNSNKQFVFGSLVGILLGVPASHALLQILEIGWWTLFLTIPVFGSLGYIFYDVREVLSSIKKATKEVVQWRPDKDKILLYGSLWKDGFGYGSGLGLLGFLFLTGVGLFSATDALFGTGDLVRAYDYVHVFTFFGLAWILFMPILMGTVTAGLGWLGLMSTKDIKYCSERADRRNLISLSFLFVRKSYWLVWAPIFALWFILKHARQIVALAYSYIHSDERRAVFATVALGIMIGFGVDLYAGNIILATLSGAILGIPLGLFLHRVVAVRLIGVSPVEV